MAQVAPFIGTRYAVDRLGDLSLVLTPPYDVISPEMQEAFYGLHPQNLIRVDFGKDLPTDREFDNKYTRASSLLEQWKQDGVLTVDDRPSFTAYEQTYRLPDGSERRRRGIWGLVKLEDLDAGVVHAHEQTFDAPKCDRFKLLRATQCNTSPVFCVYSDPQERIGPILEEEARKKPWAEFQDREGVWHRAWIISHDRTCKAISEGLADKELFIADGHHRYETALLYRDQMRAQFKHAIGLQPYDWTVMFLANTEDPGTSILPIHRALARELDDGVDPDEFFADLEEHFVVIPKKINLAKPGVGQSLADRVARAGAKRPAFGVALTGGRAALLKFKPRQNRRDLLGRSVPKAIRALDVSILHELVIRRAWVGNPEIELDDQDIFYDRDPEAVVNLLRRRRACAVFLVNPPTLEQMMAVARSGRRMPHKSTFFYPKVITGLVMREMRLP